MLTTKTSTVKKGNINVVDLIQIYADVLASFPEVLSFMIID